MWKRRDREEDQSLNQAVAPSEPARHQGILSPTSALPVRSHEPEVPRGVATIGKAVYIKGQIVSREDLVVDGNIEGTIEAQEHRVVVGPNGKVAATIKARHIVIQGHVTGNVDGSEKVEIRNGARLLGDVRTVKFVCEEDGFLTGSVSSLRNEPRPNTPSLGPEVTEKPKPTITTTPLAPQQPAPVSTSTSPSIGDVKR